jgi:hypothetical protein
LIQNSETWRLSYSGCRTRWIKLSSNNNDQDGQDKEQDAQPNGNAKQDFLDAAPGCKDTACITTGQTA